MKFTSAEHEVIFNKLSRQLPETPNQKMFDGGDHAAMNSSDYHRDISRYLKIMEQTRENHAHRTIFSHRRILGPCIVFGKKVVRKFLKWYLDPVAMQQTEFNSAATPAIGRLTEWVAHLEKNTLERVQLDKKALERVENLEKNSVEVQQQFQQQLQQLQEMQKLFAEKVYELEKRFEENEVDSLFEKRTYSQSGEDSILAYILHVLGIPYESVTYVDLGANHPKEMNNTYFFYKKGGRGVLVEANPHLISQLKFHRNRDVVLNRCIHAKSGENVDFFIMSGDGLSTTDYETAQKYMETNPKLKIVDVVKVETISYNDLVEQHLGQAPTILSLDIEGNDMFVLQSIDYEKYRPMLIVTEMIGYDTKLNYRSRNEKIKEFLAGKDYDEYAFTGINSIFLDRRVLYGKEDTVK